MLLYRSWNVNIISWWENHFHFTNKTFCCIWSPCCFSRAKFKNCKKFPPIWKFMRGRFCCLTGGDIYCCLHFHFDLFFLRGGSNDRLCIKSDSTRSPGLELYDKFASKLKSKDLIVSIRSKTSHTPMFVTR